MEWTHKVRLPNRYRVPTYDAAWWSSSAWGSCLTCPPWHKQLVSMASPQTLSVLLFHPLLSLGTIVFPLWRAKTGLDHLMSWMHSAYISDRQRFSFSRAFILGLLLIQWKGLLMRNQTKNKQWVEYGVHQILWWHPSMKYFLFQESRLSRIGRG